MAAVNAALLAFTLLWPEWIELVFGVEPDAGSGALERWIVVMTIALSMAFLVMARAEWRRVSAHSA